MITQSYFDKRKVDEIKRKEDFRQIQSRVNEFFESQDGLKGSKKLAKKASEVVNAMLERKALELGEADRAAYLVPLVYYYVVTGKPITISTGTLEYQKQLIREVQELYRSITGKKAKILNCIGNEAEIIVVHGVDDPGLTPTKLRYADLRSQSIAGNYITFCSHEFLIRDRMFSPDEYDLMYGFFTSKYDTFIVAQADKLRQAALSVAAKNWDHNSAKKLLKDLQFYARGLSISEPQVEKALLCLAKLNEKLQGGKEVVPSDFVPLRNAMEEIEFPPATEWGSFYSKERHAGKTMIDREFTKQMDALAAICSCKEGDTFGVVHEWNNNCVHTTSDEQSFNGVREMKELIGKDKDLSLVIAG